jgi:hypothetical protein
MSLEQLVHQVEARLAEVGRRLLQPSPRQVLEAQIEELTEELAARQADRDRSEQECAAARRRLEEIPPAAALLPSQIESSLQRGKHAQAFRQALELERLRRTLAEDQAALPRLEQTCWSLDFHVRLLQRRLARLREELRRL